MAYPDRIRVRSLCVRFDAIAGTIVVTVSRVRIAGA